MLKCILQLCSQTFRVKFQDSLNYILHILLFLRSFNGVNSFDLQMVSEIGHSDGAPIYCLVPKKTQRMLSLASLVVCAHPVLFQ